jgi:hypothetical protein
MANEFTVEIDELPRMADFARWTAAACPALGWDADELLAAYADNRAAANETTLDASPLVEPLRRLGSFEGAATELLAELVEIVGEGPSRAKHWPKAPHVLSGALRRLAPSLRRADPPMAIDFEREGPTGRRVIRVSRMEWVRKEASEASEASATDGTDATDARLHTHSNGPAPIDEHDLADQLGIEIQGEG